MEPLYKSRQMHEDMIKGCTKTEEVIRALRRRNYEEVAQGLETIKSNFNKNKTRSEEIQNKVIAREELLDEIQRRNTLLEEWVNKYQPTLDRLIVESKNSNIARLTEKFEKKLATLIYPPHTKVSFGEIFPDLMSWLDERKYTPEGRDSNRKWEAFVKEFNWTENHKKVFLKMLLFEKDIDQEDINFESVFTDAEKFYVNKIRDISQQLKKK